MRKVFSFLLSVIIVIAILLCCVFVSGIIDDLSEGDTGGVVIGGIATIYSISFVVLCSFGIRKLNKPKNIDAPIYEVSYTVVSEPVHSVAYTEPPKEIPALEDGTLERYEPAEGELTSEMVTAMDAIMRVGIATVPIIQRDLRCGYSQAARLLDNLEDLGFVGPFEGSNPRKILVTREQWENAKSSGALSDMPFVEYRPTFPDVEMLRNYELMSVDLMEGADFETWCAKALTRRGFCMVTQTGKTGDQGVDITAIKDGIKYAIQCKRYSHPLGNTPVQEVYAGKNMYDCQIGVVMTNQTFTDGAIQLANKTGVLLWDRTYIVQIIRDMIVDQSKE